jgi:transcription antitermination factor NusG
MRHYVLVLSEFAIDCDPKEIRRGVIRTLGCRPTYLNKQTGSEEPVVFVPAGVTEYRDATHVDYLLTGYAFLSDVVHPVLLHRLTDSKYVSRVLTSGGEYATISSEQLEGMRQKTEEAQNKTFLPGDVLTVLSGPYKDLSGSVICLLPDGRVQIEIVLLSKRNILTVPPSFLAHVDNTVAPLGHGVLSVVDPHTTEVDRLLRAARRYAALPSMMDSLQARYNTTLAHKRLLDVTRMRRMFRHLVAFFGPFTSLQPKIDRYVALEDLVDRFRELSKKHHG